MNSRSAVDVCFCLLQQLQWFMTLLRYLSHWNLKADRLMISILVAGFHSCDLKIITGRAHTPLCAFMMLFMTKISRRHQLFLTDWLSCVFFLCCPSWKRDSDLPMKRWIYNKQRKLTSPKMLHPKTFLIFPVCLLCSLDTFTDWVEFPSIIFALWRFTIKFSW